MKSQSDRIAAYLAKGRTLTALSALHLFSCMRLAARIAEIRERGLGVRTDRIKLKSGKTVAQYSVQA